MLTSCVPKSIHLPAGTIPRSDIRDTPPDLTLQRLHNSLSRASPEARIAVLGRLVVGARDTTAGKVERPRADVGFSARSLPETVRGPCPAAAPRFTDSNIAVTNARASLQPAHLPGFMSAALVRGRDSRASRSDVVERAAVVREASPVTASRRTRRIPDRMVRRQPEDRVTCVWRARPADLTCNVPSRASCASRNRIVGL